MRKFIVESLVEAGADVSYAFTIMRTCAHSLITAMNRIKDKNGDTIVDLLRPNDTELRTLIRKAQAQASISHADIVNGKLFHLYCGPKLTLLQRTKTTESLARDLTVIDSGCVTVYYTCMEGNERCPSRSRPSCQ
jgi:hypothetical protein